VPAEGMDPDADDGSVHATLLTQATGLKA
jgi:hypothetical protein